MVVCNLRPQVNLSPMVSCENSTSSTGTSASYSRVSRRLRCLHKGHIRKTVQLKSCEVVMECHGDSWITRFSNCLRRFCGGVAFSVSSFLTPTEQSNDRRLVRTGQESRSLATGETWATWATCGLQRRFKALAWTVLLVLSRDKFMGLSGNTSVRSPAMKTFKLWAACNKIEEEPPKLLHAGTVTHSACLTVELWVSKHVLHVQNLLNFRNV